ncbi:MAG TPA: squalene synthase HpnC [Vicinamibacterales bacterium]|nr:squalene synthase HpnC [Vicinamibacterales bacterium]
MTVADAYAWCERLAREHYENFPVASKLVPAAMRPHIAAIYAFARGADDLADEGDRPPAERLRLLDAWSSRLHAAVRGEFPDGPEQPVFVALADTIRTRALPVSLFEDLLSAFRQDVIVTRYDTWADLLDYCRRSANPVGRLVLRVAGCATPQRDASSDGLCTALQLTNFWQDLDRDWHKGRLYVPRELWQPAGAYEDDLERSCMTGAWQMALGGAASRTRALFEAGRLVCDEVPGRLRWELRATWIGGMRVLERLEHAGFDVFAARPHLGAADAPPLLWRLLTWRRGPQR